ARRIRDQAAGNLAQMRMPVDQPRHDESHRGIKRFARLEPLAMARRLADRDDALLAYGDRAVSDDLALLVEGEQSPVLDQGIDILHFSLGLGAINLDAAAIVFQRR